MNQIDCKRLLEDVDASILLQLEDGLADEWERIASLCTGYAGTELYR